MQKQLFEFYDDPMVCHLLNQATPSVGPDVPKPLLGVLWRQTGMASGLTLLGLLLSLATGTLAAWGQAVPLLWSGVGQIINGQGQGATVQLVVETQNGRIRTQSGPFLDAPFSGKTTTIQNEEGTWQIEVQGDQLLITVYRGNQIIRYLLQASPGSASGSQFRSNILPYQPVDNTAPVVSPVVHELIPIEPIQPPKKPKQPRP